MARSAHPSRSAVSRMPSKQACRGAHCPSLYESRISRPPARDLVEDSPNGPWYGCAATVGGFCRLCGERPDLSARGPIQLSLLPGAP